MSVSQILFIYHIDISNFRLRFMLFFHMQCFSLKMLSKCDSILPTVQKRWFLHIVLKVILNGTGRQTYSFIRNCAHNHSNTMCKATK